MALENVGSFQYLIRKTKSASPPPKKNEALNSLIPGAQMALEIFGLFGPLVPKSNCS